MSYFTRPFFALVETFWAVLPLVVAIDLLALFLLIFKEKKMDPRSFAFWVALIVVLPFLGFALYLLFGCSLYSVSIFGRKFGGDRAMGIMDDPRIRGADRATDGNDVRFYGEFPKVLPDLVDDVLAATSTVHLEFYKMPREGDIKALVEAVCRKGSEGLDIRFLLCRGVPKSLGYIRRMNASGVKFKTFNRRFISLILTRFRMRNYRLMAVVDGQITYVGGNFIIRADGPAAARVEARFHADWAFAVGRHTEPLSVAEPRGNVPVQVVSSGPDLGKDLNPAMAEYVALIKTAEREIKLTEPYLVPDENIYNFLKLSALSGISVQILVSRNAWHWYQRWNTTSAAASLVDSGVRVFLTERRFHDSFMVIDGRISAVGMAPFNSKAMLQDFHTSLIVASEDTASDVDARMEELMEEAAEFSREAYEKRTFGQRLKIAVSRLMMLFNRGVSWGLWTISWNGRTT